MSIGVVVFARMGSRRLPGKALLPVEGRPLVGHVFDRARLVRQADTVILATSSDESDDRLAAFAHAEGIACFRGSVDNVVERALQCARTNGLWAFARICGDRLFFDPATVDSAIERMKGLRAEAVDMVTNLLDGPVAAGLTTEILRTEVLDTVLREATEAEDLEHLTRYIYRHPDIFRLVAHDRPPPKTEGLRFAVDTAEDLKRARYVARHLPHPALVGVEEITLLTLAWEQQSHQASDA